MRSHENFAYKTWQITVPPTCHEFCSPTLIVMNDRMLMSAYTH